MSLTSLIVVFKRVSKPKVTRHFKKEKIILGRVKKTGLDFGRIDNKYKRRYSNKSNIIYKRQRNYK